MKDSKLLDEPVLDQSISEFVSESEEQEVMVRPLNRNKLFDELFVFDMANNHQGDMDHAKNIISHIGRICKEKRCKGALKFQYRQLDTFIHPDYKEAKEPKHISRFLSTRLSNDQFFELVQEVKKAGLLSMCTPFDEDSVDVIVEHEIDIIKVASCSAKDWPLLEGIARTKKPVISSTAGCRIKDIDRLVSFFMHFEIPFAIMHCVALYQTKEENLHLNRIDIIKERYPFLTVGFSTHEEPDNMLAIQIAMAKGAKLFERHVGMVTDKISLNAYSSTPEQIESWIDSMQRAKKLCGSSTAQEPDQIEVKSLKSLQRGVYAGKDIKEGEEINLDDVFFAMPAQEKQIVSGEFANTFAEKFVAKRDYKKGDPISSDEKDKINLKRNVFSIIHEARSMLYKARIAVGKEFQVELSHHYGLEKFKKVGAIIINCVNEEYCKKLILQVAGQHHPTHYHGIKEETFQVLYGRLKITVDGVERELRPGDQAKLKPGQKHSFTTETGVIVEEISTTHHINDSFYDDDNISEESGFRKTILEHGEHTFEQYDFL